MKKKKLNFNWKHFISFKACTGAFLNLTLLLKIKKRCVAKPDEAVKKLYISQALCHLVLNFFLMPLSITASVTRKYLFIKHIILKIK